ncbi:MAG: metallophosphoesterase, partial [Clostridia bacterium]|nr:metallophosphoesterase [Clostridia bacterium]
MKKLYFLFVILLCLAVLSPIWAVSAGSSEVSSVSTDRTGVSFDMETSGDIVHPTGYYYAHKRLEQIPVTLEAWIYIPAEVYNLEGSIISNYAEIPGDEFFNFAISAYGIPTFWVGKGKGTSYSTLSFAEAKVPADKWTHIALVYGTGIEGKQAFCYINGTLKAKSSPNDYVKMKKGIFENAVCIGGDMRSFNLGGFKGTLGDVKVYADVRSEKEIAADMKNPANNKDNQLIMSFDISAKMQGKHIPDKSGNGYDMYYGEIWLTEEEMQEIRAKDPTEYAYSIAVIPDPQYSTQLYPESLKSIFDYVLENYEEKNMQYVASVGDLTEGNYYVHWDKVKAQTDRLNGIVPYTVLRGNHDTYHDANILDEYYCQPSEYYYKHVHKNGGAFTDETLCNTYLLFEVGNVKYLLLNLDWDVSNEALAWADEVLSAHPDRRVIAVTHGYLDADGTTLDVNDEGSPAVNTGEDIWNKLLRKHANVHMVLCGHIEQDDILLTTAKGDNGNIVYQFLIDTQRPDAWLKGGGFISTLYFSEDGNKVRVECYSNTYKKYFRTASNTISFEVGSEFNRETVEDTTTDFVPTLPPQDDDSSTSTPAFMPNAAGSVIGMQINGETVVSSADYIEKMGYATDDTWTAVSTAVDFVAALKKAGAKIYLTQDVDFKDYTGYLNGGGNIVQIANGVTVDGCGYGMKNVTLSGKTHVYPFWYKGADQLIFKNFNVGREDARVKVSSTNYSYTCAFLYGNTTAAILIDNVKMWA